MKEFLVKGQKESKTESKEKAKKLAMIGAEDCHTDIGAEHNQASDTDISAEDIGAPSRHHCTDISARGLPTVNYHTNEDPKDNQSPSIDDHAVDESEVLGEDMDKFHINPSEIRGW